MIMQNYARIDESIRERFQAQRQARPGDFERRLELSWSNWGFGTEDLAVSAARLKRFGISCIELHGNHYGPDLGYRPTETLRLLVDQGLRVAGICGMFSAENDLSSPNGRTRQAALDYLKRTLDFASAVKAEYILVVPGAVGRPGKYDDCEFERSVATLRPLAGEFAARGIKAAIEPIRAAEVSFCHTVADAKRYLDAVAVSGVNHINGDVFHMQAGESHIGAAVLEAGEQLVNLHLADSQRGALGEGSLDVDTLIMALYLIGYNRPGCYVTPEPLGPGADPYPAMHGRPDPALLDHLVEQTARYFREREAVVRAE